MEKQGTELPLLASITILLFVIGLIVMLFTLFGSELQITTDESASASIVNETLLFTNATGTDTSVSSLREVALSNVIVEGCK